MKFSGALIRRPAGWSWELTVSPQCKACTCSNGSWSAAAADRGHRGLLTAVLPLERYAEILNMLVLDAIEDVRAESATGQHVPPVERRQMLRHVGLAHCNLLEQLAHASLAIDQCADDPKSRRSGQHSEVFGRHCQTRDQSLIGQDFPIYLEMNAIPILVNSELTGRRWIHIKWLHLPAHAVAERHRSRCGLTRSWLVRSSIPASAITINEI